MCVSDVRVKVCRGFAWNVTGLFEHPCLLFVLVVGSGFSACSFFMDQVFGAKAT